MNFKMQGLFYFEHWRKNELLSREKFFNGITNQGKSYLLAAALSSPAASPQPMYVGLLKTSFSPNDATDTITSINTHEFTDYTVSANAVNRATWDPDTTGTKNVGGNNIVYYENSTLMQFDATNAVSENLYGVFVTGSQPKSDYNVSYTLWSSGAFSSTQAIILGDNLKFGYQVGVLAS